MLASPPDIGNTQICFSPFESSLKKAIDEPSGENLGFPSVLPLVNSLGAESESFISLIQRELFNFSDLMSGLETPYTARFPSGEMDTPVGFASS